MGLFRSLENWQFALVWGGQTLSRVGDAIQGIALAWLILELTQSAAAMGVVLAVRLVASLALTLVGGVAVDRLPRLRVMLAADIVRMGIVAVVAALIVTNQILFWHLVALGGVLGAVDAFFYPAFVAAVPELVVDEHRASANSLTQLSRRLASIVGPGIGAILVASGGTGPAFAIDAASYGASALMIVGALARSDHASSQVARPAAPEPASEDNTVQSQAAGRSSVRRAVADLRAGFATVRTEPWIWITILVASLTGITLTGPLEAGLPLLVSEHLSGNVGALGVIDAAMAGGAVGAAVYLGTRSRIRRRGPVLYAAWITLALAVAAAGLPIGVAGVALLAVIIGAAGAALGLAWTSALQDKVPGDRLGRVASIDAIGSWALEPIGFVTAGTIADAIGPAQVFLAGGLASAAILGLALIHPAVRALD